MSALQDEFERWATALGLSTKLKGNGPDYERPTTSAAWLAYLAATTRAAERCEERGSMFLALVDECEAKGKHALANIHGNRRIEAEACAAAIRGEGVEGGGEAR